MKKIFKYPVEPVGKSVMQMPIGAEILTVQTQNGEPFIWALVDPDAVKESVVIRVYGTGHDYNTSVMQRYIGTFQLLDGSLVMHVFREKEIGPFGL